MKTKDEFYKLEMLKSKRKYFRIEQIISGLMRIEYCKLENAFYWTPFTGIVVKLNDKTGEEWPDLLSDYHWENYLILSERTFGIFEENGISNNLEFKMPRTSAQELCEGGTVSRHTIQ